MDGDSDGGNVDRWSAVEYEIEDFSIDEGLDRVAANRGMGTL